MRSRFLTILLATALGAASGCASEHTRGRSRHAIVGTWRLERYADTPEGQASVYPFGVDPIGIMVFSADGYFSVSLMRNPPAIHETGIDPDPDACIPAWYCSYFGTYNVGESGSTWTTHVLGGNIPNYLGSDQSRSFTIRGDTLIISEEYVAEGRTVHGERVLVREPLRE